MNIKTKEQAIIALARKLDPTITCSGTTDFLTALYLLCQALETFIASISGGSTIISQDNTVFVDAEFGDDGTGVRQNFLMPFQTIAGAIQAAAIGDKIVISPGTYTHIGTITVNKRLTLMMEGVVIQSPIGQLAPTLQFNATSAGSRIFGNPNFIGDTGTVLDITGGTSVSLEIGDISSISTTFPAIHIDASQASIVAGNISHDAASNNPAIQVHVSGSEPSSIKANSISRLNNTGPVVDFEGGGTFELDCPCIISNRGAALRIPASGNSGKISVIGCEMVNESTFGFDAQCIDILTTASEDIDIFLRGCVLLTSGAESIVAPSTNGHTLSLLSANHSWKVAGATVNVVAGALDVNPNIPAFCDTAITP